MADFIDIPIDVTAEQIEEMAKRQVDTVAKRGSTNLITSDAVAMVEIDSENILPDAVLEKHIANNSINTAQVKDKAITGDKIADFAVTNVKIKPETISGDKIMPNAIWESRLGNNSVSERTIADGAVTEGKLANSAVTEDKIADQSIDHYHIKPAAVTPNALDRQYLRLDYSWVIINDSTLINMLTTSLTNLSDSLKKIFIFAIRSIPESGFTSVLKKGKYFGFLISDTEFWATHFNSNTVYSVKFNNIEDSIELISIVPVNVVDQSYKSDSLNAQSGVAVAEAVKKVVGVAYRVSNFDDLYALTLSLVGDFGYGKSFLNFYTAGIKEKDIELPEGSYLAIGNNQDGAVGCWNYSTNTLYRISRGYPFGGTELAYSLSSSKDISDVGDYFTDKTVEGALQEIGASLGDVDTALDNIIALQNSYIGGAEE